MWFRIDDLVVREWLGIPPHARIKKGGGQEQHSNFFRLHYRITRKYASDHLAVSKPLEKFSVSTQRHEYMFVINLRLWFTHDLPPPPQKKIKSKRNLSSIWLQKKKKWYLVSINTLCPSTIFKWEHDIVLAKPIAAFWTQFLWLRWLKTGGNEEQFGVMNIGREIWGPRYVQGVQK